MRIKVFSISGNNPNLNIFPVVDSQPRVDTDATVSDDDIGKEIDVSLNWKIFSDLSVAFQYGLFMPGDAFPDSANDNEEYFSVASTFTF